MNIYKNLLVTFAFLVPFNASVMAADYLIGAGDVIEINVYQQPDLKALKTVSAAGEVSFPIIGLVEIGAMTEHQAENLIERRLEDSKVINNPEVAVRVVEFRSATVAVDGMVARPGEVPVIGFLTVHQLISKVGGLREGANPVVTFYRPGLQPRKIDLLEIYRDGAVNRDYTVKSGDRIFVDVEDEPPVFYTYGAVVKNGAYELEEGMTVMQALALSGGRTEAATKTRVKIFRASNNEGGGLVEIDASEEDIVQANDVIRIEESRF